MEVINCSICKSKRMITFAEAEYHLNLERPFGIQRCLECGFIFMSPRPDDNERTALFNGTVPEILKPYSATGANYGAVTQSRLNFFRKRINNLILSLAKRPGEIRFLDIGASSGYMVQAALEAGLLAEGVEPGSSGIAEAKKRGIDLINAPAEKLPFNDDQFDIIHSHHVFEHVADPLISAKEAFRVLKPGGTILIEVPNQFDNIRFKRDMIFKKVPRRKRDIRSIHHLSFFGGHSLKNLLIQAGFKHIIISSRYAIYPQRIWQIIPGYLTMLVGLFYLGGERTIAKGRK